MFFTLLSSCWFAVSFDTIVYVAVWLLEPVFNRLITYSNHTLWVFLTGTRLVKLTILVGMGVIREARGRGGFRGGAPGARPLCFSGIGRLTLCWPPRQKGTKSCGLTLKITNFLRFWGGTSPLRHPLSWQAPKFCQSLIWAPPLL